MRARVGQRATRLAVLLGLVLMTAALATTPGALAVNGTEAEVTVGSNDFVFSQNKQNEPMVAVNPANPDQVVAGANDNIDLEACNVEEDNTCPFTAGVGVTGFQGSTNGGLGWVQPDYTGYSARHCTPPPDPAPDDCEPQEDGPIGTLPWYFENGVVSFGDPVQTWGPIPGADGSFSWENGQRLYFINLTFDFPGQDAFRGSGAIGVSRTDDFESALAGDKAAWEPPVLVSGRMGVTDFSDKEWIAADDAESSPFFGNVYACWVEFRSFGAGPEPLMFTRSTDGGDTWSQPQQLSEAANTGTDPAGGRQGCQVDTDSDGVVYVFFIGSDPRTQRPSVHKMVRSFDGGQKFERPRPVATVEDCGLRDPATGRLSFDGVAGARTNSFASVSIANGAPEGNGPDTIFMTWCDGPTPSDTSPGANEQALVQWSTNKGRTWNGPVAASLPGDRPDFPAVALSPDGTDAYLTYMAFHTPWQSTTANPRMFEGVVLHAEVNPATGEPGAFTEVHRGAAGDARGSAQNNLVAGFLGDYNAVSATNDFAVAVWNDTREAADCPAIDAYRQAFVEFQQGEGERPTAPAPQVECAPTFGNTDIWGARVEDPS